MPTGKQRERTLILSSGKCAWGKCNYCGYGKLDAPRYGHEDLKEQIDNYFRGVPRNEIDVLRVYVSGNVTDRSQIPVETQEYLVQKVRKWGIDTLLVESLPQFITEKTLEPFQQDDVHLIFAIGLECYDDELRSRLRKGFDREDFERACELIRERGWGIKVYLLVNPPFVGNPKEELDRSVEYAKEWADEITLINCQPHEGTGLHEMYQNGEWEPLDKGEFFDLAKEHLSDSQIRYDVSQYEPFPPWKSWLPRFENEKPIVGVGEEQLVNEKYERWQDFLCERYRPREEKDSVLFVPCSYTKPYVDGPLHRSIREALDGLPNSDGIHLVVVSSPGVVPIEFSGYYPFDSYDWQPWNETPDIKERYTEVTKERVKRYLEAHDYRRHFCYFRHDAESYQAVEEACEELGVDLKQCLGGDVWEEIRDTDNPLAGNEALESLKRSLIPRSAAVS